MANNAVCPQFISSLIVEANWHQYEVRLSRFTIVCRIPTDDPVARMTSITISIDGLHFLLTLSAFGVFFKGGFVSS